MAAAWEDAKTPLEPVLGRRGGAPLLAISSNVGDVSAPPLDLFNWFLGFPLMHNVEHMCGTILWLTSEYIMHDEFKSIVNNLSADKATGHCVASAQKARRALNAAVVQFEEYCSQSTDTVEPPRKKRKKTSEVQPLSMRQRIFFAPFLRLATTLVSHVYSRAHPSLAVVLAVHVRAHLVFIMIYLLSHLVGMKSKSGKPTWASKNVYSQDWVAHLGNYLEKFRAPLAFLLEENLERSFQPMNDVVQSHRTQAVQLQEAIATYFQEEVQSCGLGAAAPVRSAVASSFHIYEPVDIFMGWCVYSLLPMCSFNVSSLLWRLSFSVTVRLLVMFLYYILLFFLR
jgi:hypothetical protein